MKKNLFLLSMIFITFFVTSCAKNENPQLQVEKSELLKSGERFAMIHNECLANFYTEMINIQTRSSLNDAEVRTLIMSSVNNYIALKATTRSSEIDVSQIYNDMPIEEIRESLTEKEAFYIDKALSLHRVSTFDELLVTVEEDSELPDLNKLAVICFITTLDASTRYWDEHLGEWITLFELPQTRGWKEVAFADAWWGYQGTILSGFNLWGGAAAAAVASIGTAIF